MRRVICEAVDADACARRARRWQRLQQRGVTVWLTGLSGSGKTTVASAVEEELIARGRWAYRLDGDNLRQGLSADLGFTHEDRTENVRRVSEAALLFADAGAVALVCLVSPYVADRALARALHQRAGIDFIEVFVNTSLQECERRDIKGLYARARAGSLPGLTGVDAPYEPPTAPEVELDESLDVATAAARVLAALSMTETS
jgi:adenylyl-sulfate kinase